MSRWLLGIVVLVLGLHALPTHADVGVVTRAAEVQEVAPPTNIKPPALCVKHQTYVNGHGKTVTACEPIAQFEAEGKTLTPTP